MDAPMYPAAEQPATGPLRWAYWALIGAELFTVAAGLGGAALWDPYVARPAIVAGVAHWLAPVPGLRSVMLATMEPLLPAFLTIVIGCVLVARRHDMTPRLRWWGLGATVLLAGYIVVSLGLLGDVIEMSTPQPPHF
jgi:hypothetical protein